MHHGQDDGAGRVNDSLGGVEEETGHLPGGSLLTGNEDGWYQRLRGYRDWAYRTCTVM